MTPVFGRGDLLAFWVAVMDFKTAPEIVDAMREKVSSGVFGYPLMTDSARESVTNWLEARHGFSVDASDVGFSPGVITSLSVAVQTFTEPGDGVVIQTPAYPQFFSIVKRNDRTVVENPLKETADSYEMDYDNLREVLTPNVKAIFLCSPHNPVGRVWRADELRRLAEICGERGVVILSDEIHHDITFDGARHVPFQLAAPESSPMSIIFMAPSKTFNVAGLCGSAWLSKDKKIAARMQKALVSVHCSEVNMIALAALEAAYGRGAPWLDSLTAYLRSNRDLVVNFLRERLPKARMKHQEGTFISWLDFRGYGLSGKELQEALVQKARVALNPGVAFGKDYEAFARLNIGCPKATLKEGLDRIGDAFAGL
jgi:cystathionine beta-lyase